METKVAIVGAGISGLVAGYYLTKQGVSVTVFEADSYPGGITRSFMLENQWIDVHNHFVLRSDSELIGLLEELSMNHILQWK